MAGITLILNRDGAPVERQRLDDALAALQHRGVDGEARWSHANYALGQQNFLVCPEDACGPLVLEAGGESVAIAFDGRLDNREELLQTLTPPAGTRCCDANLAARAYLCWGAAGFDRLRGSLALILADTRADTIHLYRNPLGSRELYYFLSPRHLLAATEPAALLRHPAVSSELDETWLAGYFSFYPEAGSRTVYQAIRQLLPGERLTRTPETVIRRREIPAIGSTPLTSRSDADYADRFRELLMRATARVCRSRGPIGIMLSSGLDSGSVAYCAADHLRSRDRSLTAYSWSLRHFPEADESTAIEALAANAGITLNLQPADDCWPLSELESWPLTINTPVSNAFQRLNERVHHTAAEAGCRVLLNAGTGDSLYPEPHYWLAEALFDRRWRLFLSELRLHLHYIGLTGLHRDRALRQIVKQASGWRPRPNKPPPWLTEQARRLYQPRELWPPEAHKAKRHDQYRTLLGLYLVNAVTSVNHFTNPLGIELRDPYLDWELVDFMLSIPAWQYFQQDRFKFIARNAMRGRMLESIRTQGRVGILTPFFEFGLFDRSRPLLRTLLLDPAAEWPRYVHKRWVSDALAQKRPDDHSGLLIWQCAAFELWRKKYFA